MSITQKIQSFEARIRIGYCDYLSIVEVAIYILLGTLLAVMVFKSAALVISLGSGPSGGLLAEGYLHGMNHVAEAVRSAWGPRSPGEHFIAGRDSGCPKRTNVLCDWPVVTGAYTRAPGDDDPDRPRSLPLEHLSGIPSGGP